MIYWFLILIGLKSGLALAIHLYSIMYGKMQKWLVFSGNISHLMIE